MNPIASHAEAKAFEAELDSPEMRLLTAALRGNLNSDALEELPEIEKENFNAGAFLNLCENHRLGALAHQLLVKPRRARFPTAELSQFENRLRRKNLEHLRQISSLLSIHRAFKHAGISHLFLKGPVLASRLFGARILRHSGDMDVLIRPRDRLRAHACLVQLGFTRKSSPWRDALRLPPHWQHRKDSVYGSLDRGWVELHTRTDISEALLPRDFDMSQGVDRVEFHGETFPVLPKLLECVYLCVHASGHNWSHFGWLFDIVLFMRLQKLEPEAVFIESRRLGLEIAVREAFYLSDRILGTAYLPASGQRPFERHEIERLAYCYRIRLQTQRLKSQTLALVLKRAGLYPGFAAKLHYFCVLTADQILFRLGNRARPIQFGKQLAG
jgi:hypothetical protein